MKTNTKPTKLKKVEVSKGNTVLGKVIQFRRGRNSYTPRHFLIEVDGTNSRENASKFIGKELVWTSDGKNAKKINGKISAAHGNKGVLRAIFEKGLPGQAIGSEVEIK
jgi:large subunit ribosomal protein L35Ae